MDISWRVVDAHFCIFSFLVRFFVYLRQLLNKLGILRISSGRPLFSVPRDKFLVLWRHYDVIYGHFFMYEVTLVKSAIWAPRGPKYYFISIYYGIISVREPGSFHFDGFFVWQLPMLPMRSGKITEKLKKV